MDIREFEEVAAARWKETTTPTTKITEAVFAVPENTGWKICSIYSYHCFTGHNAYAVILWRSCGIKDGVATIQIKGSLVTFDEDSDTYHVEKIKKIY